MQVKLTAEEILAIREALLAHKHQIARSDGYDHPAVAAKQELVDKFNILLSKARGEA